MHVFSKAPSLPPRYWSSPLVWASPTSTQGRFRVMHFPWRWPFWPPRWISQAPRLIFPRALSPITPEGPASACACCFPLVLPRLHPAGRTGHLQLANEAESGLRNVTAHVFASQVPSAPIPGPPLGSATCRTGNYMVNSFQFTRPARLILAYPASASTWSGAASHPRRPGGQSSTTT